MLQPMTSQIAVLFSERSRAAYAQEAAARGETYTFTEPGACHVPG